MRERGILFSGPLVRALLAGTKTQTRRLVRNPPGPGLYLQPLWGVSPAPNPTPFGEPGLWTIAGPDYPDGKSDERRCPYGAPGDRLWVRETGWEPKAATARERHEGADTWPRYAYDADGLSESDAAYFKAWGWKRRPSIHMPRWASRITLELTDVRVQRLQEISEGAAIAEGLPPFFERFPNVGREQRLTSGERAADAPHRAAFAVLWDDLNGDRALWASNPLVWVLTFRRLSA